MSLLFGAAPLLIRASILLIACVESLDDPRVQNIYSAGVAWSGLDHCLNDVFPLQEE